MATSPTNDAASYVGRSKCVVCHPREHELWLGSHHDRALEVADANTVQGRFDGGKFDHFGVATEFSREGERFRVRTDGPDGASTLYDAAYTIGVAPLQQYLLRFERGRYQALNVCWDSRPAEEGGQRWFHLYPDEPVAHDDALHWTGPYQNWNFMCAECHSTNLQRNYEEADDSYATTWSEIDVSCEACHGPGSEHVAWAENYAKGPSTAERGSIGLTVALKDRDNAQWSFVPGTPTARRSVARQSNAQLETCAQCHSRRAPIADRYAPGEKFLDHYQPALLSPALYHADGQVLDEVYEYGSFVQSKMHAAGVSCTDCHEPHTSKLRAEGNAMCAKCHQAETFDAPSHHHHEQGKPGSQCVECHMPTKNFMVVDARHDHSFRVPRPDLSVELGTPNACSTCHSDKSTPWAAQAAQGWWGETRKSLPHYGRALHAGRTRALDAGDRLHELLRDPTAPAIARATGATLLGELGLRNAAQLLEPALEDPDPLVRSAAASALRSIEPGEGLERAVPLLSDPARHVRIEAARALVGVPRAGFSAEHLTALDRAVGEYRRSQLVNRDRAEAHLNLGELELDLGDADAAQREFTQAIRLSPRLPAGYANLADVQRALGRESDAEASLRRGLQAAPTSADLHHALGLALIRQQRREEALEALARAVEFAPDRVRYRYVHGVALQAAGFVHEALTQLQIAHAQQPTDLDVLGALIAFHQEQGQRAEALHHAQQYLALDPSNAGLKALVESLRSTR